MRLTIILALLLLIPAYAVVLEWVYVEFQRPALITKCRALLDDAQLKDVRVEIEHFDATLSGICLTPEDRDLAHRLIDSLPGLRVKDGNNMLRVPARVQARIEGGTLFLEGWLPSETMRREITSTAADFRPDLQIISDGVRLLPRIEMGPDREIDDEVRPVVFASLLESVRAPASLSINRAGEVIELRGYLPSAAMRAEIIQIIQQSPGAWQVDASRFHASSHVARAPFVERDDLPRFVRSFFATPSPGTFSIDQRNGPRITAHATVEMESDWLRLLRPMSGSSRVDMQITRVPSPFHLPGYRAVSQIAPELMAEIRETKLYFDVGSADFSPAEAAKLEPLAYTIMAAGPAVRIVIAGYADAQNEPGASALRMRRANLVQEQLLALGVDPQVVRSEAFDVVRPPGHVSEAEQHAARCVEFLIE